LQSQVPACLALRPQLKRRKKDANSLGAQNTKPEDTKLHALDNYNRNKYRVADFDALTEAEKLQMARDLRALELQGILEYRDGMWGLAADVEIEETPDGPVARIRNKEEEGK
jgi:hypothetical protein